MLSYDAFAQANASCNVAIPPNSIKVPLFNGLFPGNLLPSQSNSNEEGINTNKVNQDSLSPNLLRENGQNSLMFPQPFNLNSTLFPLGMLSDKNLTTITSQCRSIDQPNSFGVPNNYTQAFGMTYDRPEALEQTDTCRKDNPSSTENGKMPSMSYLLNLMYATNFALPPALEFPDFARARSSFESVQSLYPSEALRQNKTDEDFCDLCQKHFCNKYYLRKHKTDVHGILTEPYSYNRKRDFSSISSTNTVHTEFEQMYRDGTRDPSNSNGETNGISEEITNELASNKMICFEENFDPAVNTKTEAYKAVQTSNSEKNPLQLSNLMVTTSTEFSCSNVDYATATASLPSLCGINREFSIGGIPCDNCKKVFCNQYFLDLHKLHAHTNIQDWDSGFEANKFNERPQNEKTNLFCENRLKDSTSRIGHQSNVPKSGKTAQSLRNKSPSATLDAFKNSMVAAKLADRVTCEFCKKELCNKYFLRTHKIRVHGISPKDVGGPPMRNPPAVNPCSVNHITLNLKTMPPGKTQTQTPYCFTATSKLDPNIRVLERSKGFMEHTVTSASDSVAYSKTDSPPINTTLVTRQSSDFEQPEEITALTPSFIQENLLMSNIISCPICNQIIGPKLFLPSHLNEAHGLNPVHPAFFLIMLRAKVVGTQPFDVTNDTPSLMRFSESKNVEQNNFEHDSETMYKNYTVHGTANVSDCQVSQIESFERGQQAENPRNKSPSCKTECSIHNQSSSEPTERYSSLTSQNVALQNVVNIAASLQENINHFYPELQKCGSPNQESDGSNFGLINKESLFANHSSGNNPYFPTTSTEIPHSNSSTTPTTQNSNSLPRKSPNQMRVLCEICNKWICNKYFLRTHKANKHGITDVTQQMHSDALESANSLTRTTPPYVVNQKLDSVTSEKDSLVEYGSTPGTADVDSMVHDINPIDQMTLAWRMAYNCGLQNIFSPMQHGPIQQVPLPLGLPTLDWSNFASLGAGTHLLANPTLPKLVGGLGAPHTDERKHLLERMSLNESDTPQIKLQEDKSPLNLSMKDITTAPSAFLISTGAQRAKESKIRQHIMMNIIRKAKRIKYHSGKFTKSRNNQQNAFYSIRLARKKKIRSAQKVKPSSTNMQLEDIHQSDLQFEHFTCPICPEANVFSNLNLLLHHLATNHSGNHETHSRHNNISRTENTTPNMPSLETKCFPVPCTTSSHAFTKEGAQCDPEQHEETEPFHAQIIIPVNSYTKSISSS